ncbi:hypothetical protein ES708_11537 [subsurface metagenome]
MSEETTALVIRRIHEIERLDENQILASLAGDVINEYIYQFTDSRGRKIAGLSWAGTKEIAQHRGNIVIENIDIQDRDDYIRVVAKATDLDRNVSMFGGCHQPSTMKIKKEGGGYVSVPDDFAFQKAIAKAQRNAIKNLIPATLITKLMKEYITKNQPKKPPPVKAPAPSLATGTPQEPTAITWNELYKVAWDKWKLQPTAVLKHLGVSKQSEVSVTPQEALTTISYLMEKP